MRKGWRVGGGDTERGCGRASSTLMLPFPCASNMRKQNCRGVGKHNATCNARLLGGPNLQLVGRFCGCVEHVERREELHKVDLVVLAAAVSTIQSAKAMLV